MEKEELGIEFARGWRSLPDELKVDVLKYVVMGIWKPRYFAKESIYSAEGPLKILYSSKEVAGMAREVLYQSSKFVIERGDETSRGKIKYPPRIVNDFVRRAQINVKATVRDWRFLRRLASGKIGFSNLVDMKVIINAWHCVMPRQMEHIESLRYLMKSRKINFNVQKLQVYLNYHPDAQWEDPRWNAVATHIQPILAECITSRRLDICREPIEKVEDYERFEGYSGFRVLRKIVHY